MHEQSHRDYLRSGYLLTLRRRGLLIITVITLATLQKPSARQKCQRTEAGERARYDMQMRQRDGYARCKIHEGVSRC